MKWKYKLVFDTGEIAFVVAKSQEEAITFIARQRTRNGCENTHGSQIRASQKATWRV